MNRKKELSKQIVSNLMEYEPYERHLSFEQSLNMEQVVPEEAVGLFEMSQSIYEELAAVTSENEDE